MRQALIALLFTCLLVAFGSPAQACEHANEAAAVTASAPGLATTPMAPEPCPPASACNLHACCIFALVMPLPSEAKALDYKAASFAPTPTRASNPAPLVTLDKPPKQKA